MKVELMCDGKKWAGWKSFSINKSMQQVQHSFQMETTDRYQSGLANWNVFGGSLIEIFINDGKVFEGYVQKYSPSITATSHGISISGESKAIDLVQCSHVGKYYWKDTQASSIIDEVASPFGLQVEVDGDIQDVEREGMRVPVNSSAFDVIKKLASKSGLSMFTDNDGVIRIAEDVPQSQYTLLTTGDYIQISAEHDISKQYSSVTLKGQENTYKADDFAARQQKEVKTENSGVTRYRPLVIIANGKKESVEKQNQQINRRINGEGVKVSLTLKTPYDKDDNFWGVGQRVWLKEPAIDVDQELIISSMSFSLGEQGFETKLDLQVPETFTLTEASPVTIRRSKGIFATIMGIFG